MVLLFVCVRLLPRGAVARRSVARGWATRRGGPKDVGELSAAPEVFWWRLRRLRRREHGLCCNVVI